MKVDEDILKKDLLQLLREMELFDYYRGGKKLHLTNFSPKSAEFKEGQYANECNFHVIGGKRLRVYTLHNSKKAVTAD